jgi:hypothetical protein
VAIKIQNISTQVIPVIIPTKSGGDEKRLAPREVVVITTLDKPTAQMNSLIKDGLLKVRI